MWHEMSPHALKSSKKKYLTNLTPTPLCRSWWFWLQKKKRPAGGARPKFLPWRIFPCQSRSRETSDGHIGHHMALWWPSWTSESAGKARRYLQQLGSTSWEPSTLWNNGSVDKAVKAWTPAGWSKCECPWEASEVETQLTTKKWVFAEDSNFSIFIR